MNTKKKTFAILIAIIGCLISSFNSKLATAAINIRDTDDEAEISRLISIFIDGAIFPTMSANNLLTSALFSHMTNTKGCLSNPFVHAIYGHSQNEVIAEYGFKNDIYGYILGVDNVWISVDEKYFRLGTALGYAHGKVASVGTIITGSFLELNFGEGDTDYSHDVHTVKLFAAYESFNDKRLKTNIGIIFGYNYDINNSLGKNSLEFTSHSFSLGMKFIKNLYAYNGYQFGLWLQTNYNFIFRNTDGNKLSRFQDVDFILKSGYNSLVTVIGLNVEKEAFKHADRKLILSLKTGWECPVMQRTDAVLFLTVTANEHYGVFKFRRPVKDVVIVSFNASQKLNNHWSIVGSYSARFNKDFSAHNLSGGVEYAF
ncbi:MAG: autotransporter outer membrane beta-barrel domain-containing protein [Puniceicoccales bacterium]|jgi:outer membrane autotransporter protein|nr:autotransporter outer membrane beta-barrel domain-containing protein [Puniceicoccales bacterium]